MSSRTISIAVALVAVLALAAHGSPVAAQDAPGQALFVAQGCNACHAVPAAGVPKLGDDTVAGPSLEGLGEEYKPRSLRRWLKREQEHEGYTHLQYFQGSDQELDTVVRWLLEQ